MTPAKSRALDYFRHKTAPSLTSFFDAAFWIRLVFKTSCVEASIRRAMIAVGAIHKKRDNSIVLLSPVTGAVMDSQHNDLFALIQHNKAMAALRGRMESQ